MRLTDRYDGSNDPFEGDRTLLLKTIPAGARIERASARVTPVDSTAGANPFAETFAFAGSAGDWGATKTVAPGRWVEVDFHARRTVVAVAGSRLSDTSIQVDLGGVFVEINANGSIRTPNDPPAVALGADAAPLPSLTVTKLKLTNRGTLPGAATPDISRVTVRSTPANVRLSLGDLPAVWTRPGELTRPETTSDFAAALQACVAAAQPENGFYAIPLKLHSDSIARLVVDFEIEFVVEQSVLPGGLAEVVLPFDLSGAPQARGDLLQIAAPPDSRVSARGTAARVTGTFEDTRLVPETVVDEAASAAVKVSPELSQAQPVRLAADALVTAIDLFVRVTQTVRLQLDMREDLDGKPAPSSLLPAPVGFELPGPAGQDAGAEKTGAPGAPKWVGVSLPAEFKFAAGTTYWVVLQSLEDVVEWAAAPAPADAPAGLQHTNDGGLSWRESDAGRSAGPLRASFRLRRRPQRFEMPIKLEVGEGDAAVRVDLERFQALGRVDFALEAGDLAAAVNQYLSRATGPSCPEVEHVINGDFEQWIRAGDYFTEPKRIALTRPPLSFGVAPGGAWAYVGLPDSNGGGLLGVVDVACDVLTGEEVALAIAPTSLIISPDGLHAFAANATRIQLVATDAHEPLGAPFDPAAGIANTSTALIEALALSPDGGRLYLILTANAPHPRGDETSRSVRMLYAFDAERLARAVRFGQTDLSEARLVTAELDLPARANALAVSPDGSLLYATVSSSELNGALHIIAASTPARSEVVGVGRRPEAIALTPDGAQAIVVNAGDASISFVSSPQGGRAAAVSKTLNSVGDEPGAIGVTPDGLRAYVLSGRGGALTHIDPVRRSVVGEPLPLRQPAAGLALTPQADAVYVTQPAGDRPPLAENALSVIRFGARTPFGWGLTSGSVSPVCLPEPFRRVAVLGEPPAAPADKAKATAAAVTPTALSQVVPVAENCAYDFSFWGIASEPDAVAEIFWLGADCALLQTDRVFIEEIPAAQTNVSLSLAVFQARRRIVERAPLTLHRSRLSAPAKAVQAELRFGVPQGGVAAVEAVSLIGTRETLENPDLTLQREGRLVGWELAPAAAPGVSLLGTDDGVQFRNAGANPAVLIQTIDAGGKKYFSLEWEGQAEARPSAGADPSLELYWLDAGGERLPGPTVVGLSPSGFNTAAAQGRSPAAAARAELRLVVPAATSLRVRRVSLRFLSPVDVPVRFSAQAPGELSVLDWRIAFERAEATPPPPPAGGLCAPTPPNAVPGSAASNADTQFCPHCGSEQRIADSHAPQTRSGQKAALGRCTGCSHEVARFGAQAAAASKTAPGRAAPPSRPLIRFTGLRHDDAPRNNVSARAAATAQPFVAISGIGDVRTKQLAAVGIDSVEALSIASPEDVARAKSIPLSLAPDLIEQARRVLAEENP